MMKLIRNVVIALIVLIVVLFIAVQSIQVEVNEQDLPTNVYTEDSNLGTIIQARLFSLFVLSEDNEYSIIEEIINYVILDSIRENINAEYDPLSDCETIDCTNIVYSEDYYIDYVWANLNDDNQLIVNVGVGSTTIMDFHTIIYLVMDVDIQVINTAILLTLQDVYIDDFHISVGLLETIFSNVDKDAIESKVTKGTLDLDAFTYELDFTIIP